MEDKAAGRGIDLLNMPKTLSEKLICRIAIALVISIFLSLSALGQQRLLAIGGGERPAEAMRQFVEWAGGNKARILVVTWASAEPQESFEGLRRSFEPHAPFSIEHAPVRPMDQEAKLRFLGKLRVATAVFFSGGDQNRIMDELSDGTLVDVLRARYKAGLPIGGTSAGAAVMSNPMMTGEADLKLTDPNNVGVRAGLGLLTDVIFDQHFLVRQRHNRLFGLMMRYPRMLGIGIDEDTAVLIEDDRRLTVVGKTQVMFVEPRRDGTMIVSFLKDSERFDLARRKRIRR